MADDAVAVDEPVLANDPVLADYLVVAGLVRPVRRPHAPPTQAWTEQLDRAT
ncbi:hypothetical protein V6U90_08855 [Micromonospora sp. CPCC 206060]|uniref:hypothetical protein n=1 Tax=Micromonospora sp. CPCC 206060 TaxID=3122406 RepID=UPI002FEEFE9A